MDIPLGKLEKVDVRSVWGNEAQHFTPWLAENLPLLGSAIGIDLQLEAKEKRVGSFKADIVARSATNPVLIENQLEQANHSHLGQLLTYAAGLSAVTVVWIATRFTDEHRATLDWLNTVTDDSLQFFGIEIEVWRVGGELAPKFNVVCYPATWRSKEYREQHMTAEERHKALTQQDIEALVDTWIVKHPDAVIDEKQRRLMVRAQTMIQRMTPGWTL